jgi:SOS-response transcriptional repressor LexA
MSVPNVEKVSERQQDIGNFINKFTGDSGVLEDTAGYHKALYAASNPDKMASHFYEQGKADAIREITNKSNNVSTEARQAAPKGDVKLGKWTIKGVSDGNSSKLKIKKF